MSLSSLVSSTGWKKFISMLYGFGASIVIIGALFKIQHWPGAGIMLTLGLCTEAIIFFFSAFEPLHEEVDWTLVFPELAGIPTDEVGGSGAIAKQRATGGASYAAAPVAAAPGAPVTAPAGNAGGSFGSVTSGLGNGFVFNGGAGGGSGAPVAFTKFDQMLEEADITPEMFTNLGAGMKKLSEATANIKSMGDLSSASAKYVETINAANSSLDSLANSYKTTTEIINNAGTNYKNIADSLSIIELGGKSYQEQISNLNKNLAALNTVYELQKKEADAHVKESSALFEGVQALVKNLSASAEDTNKYRDQVAKLNDNLSALNNVYGNMLAAINVK